MPRNIKIPKGATLSGLAQEYDTTVNELKVLNPTIKDINKIQAGATLTLPTLAGTLDPPPGEVVPGEGPAPTLPGGTPDRLSIFGDVLKMVTQRATKESIGRGGEALPESFLKPSQVSGRTFADILRTVAEQKSRGIADIYQSTVDLLENQRKSAENQLQLLIKEGGLTRLNDQQITQLATSTGMEFDVLMGIKNNQMREANAPKSFTIVEKEDGKYRLGFDASGNIVTETKIADPLPEDESATWNSLTPTLKEKVLSWMAKEEGFDSTDIQKMDEDFEFSNFILSRYYQNNR